MAAMQYDEPDSRMTPPSVSGNCQPDHHEAGTPITLSASMSDKIACVCGVPSV